jgi:RNA polymerase sigma-70 factor, ECF subfamily
MTRSWTDRELLDGIASRQDDAMRAFDDTFRPRMLSFARKRGLSREDAEDAVQDALMAAVRQIQEGRFESRASLLSWMLGILRRRCADIRRRNFHQGRLIVDSRAVDLEVAAADWQDHGLDVQLRVREVLLALPPRERIILLLNRQQGLPAREIAKLLHMGVKSTESILTRAKKRFCELVLSNEEISTPKRLKD